MTYIESNRPEIRLQSAVATAGLFAFFMTVGALYIIASKIFDLPALLLIAGPIALIIIYALLLALARYLRLRDDQAGDNLYYLGFLYTLTSLGVSLWQFSLNESGDKIVTNFGIAISSTIVGIGLRVLFNQLRQDPMEVERTARLQLADAARNVKNELDATVFELTSFRRATQQSFEEAVSEHRQHIERILRTVFDDLEKLPERSAAPIIAASKTSEQTISKLSMELAGHLNKSGERLTSEEERLLSSASNVTSALRTVNDALLKMQTPEGIIEIKLQPFIRGFTKAVTEHNAKMAEYLGHEEERWQRLENIVTLFEQGVSRISKELSSLSDIRKHEQEVAAKLSTADELQRETIELLKQLEQKIAATENRSAPILPLRWFGRGLPHGGS